VKGGGQVKLTDGLAALAFTLCALGAAGDHALAAECAPEKAPAKFLFHETKASNSAHLADRGIVPTGFVSLAEPTVDGIDASKYQGSVDFERIKTCGAQFAYIRLSAGSNAENELEYRALWANSRSVGLLTGPYHNLDLQEAQGPFSKLAAELQDRAGDEGISHAKDQAELFKSRLNELLRLDPKTAGAPGGLGNPYLPIALDLSSRPQSSYSSADRKAYGAVYRAAACAWIDAIKADARFADQPVIIFTTPEIYQDFDLKLSSCGLDTAKVWISYHSSDGDRPHRTAGGALAELCGGPEAADRCILQQYTSFGGFAVFRRDAGLDMNRFFGTIEDLRRLLVTAKRPS
jgi:hypothetical protein